MMFAKVYAYCYITHQTNGNQHMLFIRIRSWDKYQAYKDGRPMTWAKLYASVLDDYDFCEKLTEVQQAHFFKLLCLAMTCGNKIQADATWIGKKISAKSKVDLEALELHGFIKIEGERTDTYENVRNRTSSLSLSALSSKDISKSKSGNNRATQFPHEALPDEWRDYCAEKRPDLDPLTVFENCRDYYLSHGKPMKDWTRTWQRWVRNERQQTQQRAVGLPKDLEGLTAYARKHNLPDARPGESLWDWRSRLENHHA